MIRPAAGPPLKLPAPVFVPAATGMSDAAQCRQLAANRLPEHDDAGRVH